MQNIKLFYFYRDSGNYKTFNYVVFTNKRGLDIADIEMRIRQKLIYGTWFYADQWGLPTLIEEHCSIKDPTWHEFESVDITTETSEMDISAFINRI
ncbi:MAG: hypothetical protein C0154_12715 [Mucilaginibacter sp.]|nr:MAG: hypothetical protein BGO48_06045 [Mucilaginibacter sp. 44-25]PLW89214.1 MAG: hypothetical protein C0154_12715 [Mucilaginibacter sp.]HEK18845.1 hypothetical protein [Bacteroidota bacterium]